MLSSSDIAPSIKRRVIEDPGSGHRAVTATIKLFSSNNNPHRSKLYWNFKRADWNKYRTELENKFIEHQEPEQPDHLNRNFCNVILATAKKFIPRGRINNFKPFWNSNLEELKRERDTARNIADLTHNTADTQKWRQKCAILKREINTAKRNYFNNFLQKMDYRTDGKKAYMFIKNMEHI